MMVDAKLTKKPDQLKRWLTFGIVAIALWGSIVNTDASITTLVMGFPDMMDLFKEMSQPDWMYFDRIWEPMLDTIRIALIGTLMGAVLSIPFALFSAQNVFRSHWITYPSRFVLNLIRAVPDLLKASLFVAIFGIGTLPGVLALGFFSMGIITKLAYEEIETIDPGPLEAMTAVGAKKTVWIWFSVIPQVLPSYLSFVLYTFEINIRAAAILGLVGAGGIGKYIDTTLKLFRYDKLAVIIILTLVVVLLIDWISTKIREKLV